MRGICRNKTALLVIILLCSSLMVNAQVYYSPWTYSAEVQGIGAPNGKMPFWLRSGQAGGVPLAGSSGSFIGSAYREYDTSDDSFIKWSGGLQVRANVGDKAYLTLIEGYVKARAGIFELSGGRTRDVIGICDTALSSGSFSISGNALGIPKLRLAIPEYKSLSIFDRLFAVKASYAIGYVGNTGIAPDYAVVTHADQFYQENSLYLRLGKPWWKLNLYGGINHHAMFGNGKQVFGPGYTLSHVQEFIYAAVGKTYHAPLPDDDAKFGGKVGNHLGSIDLAASYDFDDMRLLAYHQIVYDIGAIAHLANIADGISGLSLVNKNADDCSTTWKRALFEIVYTKDQAGATIRAISGDEDYYNDFEFSEGWSYKGLNLGNPLLASRNYTRTNLPADPGDYIINNRVIAFHGAFQIAVNDINITTKLTYSQNFGTYGTSPQGHSIGGIFFKPLYGMFGRVDQFSGYIEANKTLNNKLLVGAALGGDIGGLYYNSLGLILRVRKSF